MRSDLSEIKFHQLPLKDLKRCISENIYTNSFTKFNTEHEPVLTITSLPARTTALFETWKGNEYFFQHCLLSRLASAKMLAHSVGAGRKEVMGMLIGYISNDCIVVKDCYSVPVEGTETRVNAQLESYEYIVQYMDACVDCEDRIVGWYHSHPGYGCWLSNIDIETQALNQNYQDPYLAIVIDPTKSLENKTLEVAAFRTVNEDVLQRYYSLSLKLYQLSTDANISKMKLKLDIDDFKSYETDEADLFSALLEYAEKWYQTKQSVDNELKVQPIEAKRASSSFSTNEEDVEARSFSVSSTSSLTTRHTTDIEIDDGGSIQSSVDMNIQTVVDSPMRGVEFKKEYLLKKNQLLELKLRKYARLRSYRQLFTQE